MLNLFIFMRSFRLGNSGLQVSSAMTFGNTYARLFSSDGHQGRPGGWRENLNLTARYAEGFAGGEEFVLVAPGRYAGFTVGICP